MFSSLSSQRLHRPDSWRSLLAAALVSGAVTAVPAAPEETAGEAGESHWAWQPLEDRAAPDPADAAEAHFPIRTPVDAFILRSLRAAGLSPSPPADPRTLARRAWLDLHGLPPEPGELERFLSDGRPDAYERLIDRLLASPRYGERWARHWMDLVHFAETHGHDEDAVRENAWPYRDYLIRAFNAGKPYPRFVQEQVGGDVLFPGSPDGVPATGLLAAGPWDQSSQMGIQDGTLDKEQARYLDRDDMVTTVCSTFLSVSAHCARCHDHKFDPVSQEDYYALQAVFAGVDRVERSYDPDPDLAARRLRLETERAALERSELPESFSEAEQASLLTAFEQRASASATPWTVLPPSGAHSENGAVLETLADGSVRSGGPRPETDVTTLTLPLPAGRWTALRLEVLTDPALPQGGPGRQDNGNLHLNAFEACFRTAGGAEAGVPLAFRSAAADFEQDGWTAAHALDGEPATAWGVFPRVGQPHHAVFTLSEPLLTVPGTVLTCTLRQTHGGGHLIGRMRVSVTEAEGAAPQAELPQEIQEALAVPASRRSEDQQHRLLLHACREENARARAALPPPARVYAVSSEFSPQGNFQPARGPRPVHVLRRGSISQPGDAAGPGALSCVASLPARFDTPAADEGARRAALARWITDPANPLPWRTAVNRIWQSHFGRGLVGTPNDFGKLGEPPSHPELLDWLACRFRDSGGSFKDLHRLLMTSSAYRQDSSPRPEGLHADAENRLLWRVSPLRLEAECVRDAILQVSGRLDLAMGGPSARQFGMRPGVHITPVLDYLHFDPDDPANFRRAVYRFVFRTVPDPLMQALDCPDASQLTPRRSASVTVQQALGLLHSPFVIRQSEHAANRLQRETGSSAEALERLVLLAYGRPSDPEERALLLAYAGSHGLANTVRMVLNSNEFVLRP